MFNDLKSDCHRHICTLIVRNTVTDGDTKMISCSRWIQLNWRTAEVIETCQVMMTSEWWYTKDYLEQTDRFSCYWRRTSSDSGISSTTYELSEENVWNECDIQSAYDIWSSWSWRLRWNVVECHWCNSIPIVNDEADIRESRYLSVRVCDEQTCETHDQVHSCVRFIDGYSRSIHKISIQYQVVVDSPYKILALFFEDSLQILRRFQNILVRLYLLKSHTCRKDGFKDIQSISLHQKKEEGVGRELPLLVTRRRRDTTSTRREGNAAASNRRREASRITKKEEEVTQHQQKGKREKAPPSKIREGRSSSTHEETAAPLQRRIGKHRKIEWWERSIAKNEEGPQLYFNSFLRYST